MGIYKKRVIVIDGKEIEYIRAEKKGQGLYRYILHFSDIAERYEDALEKLRYTGGKAYRGSRFKEGGVTFLSSNLQESLELILGLRDKRKCVLKDKEIK